MSSIIRKINDQALACPAFNNYKAIIISTLVKTSECVWVYDYVNKTQNQSNKTFEYSVNSRAQIIGGNTLNFNESYWEN